MTNGLVVMTPTSINYSGGSASINADGSVEFSGVRILRFDGVFTSDYDNYMMTMRHKHDTEPSAANFIRFRVGGVDDQTSTSYGYQKFEVGNTSIAGDRRNGHYAFYDASSNTRRGGTTLFIFAPSLARPTAARPISSYGYNNSTIYEWALTHNQSVAYDGFSITANIGVSPISGLVTIFAFNQ